MKVVKIQKFTNSQEATINAFLSQIPAENVRLVTYQATCWEGAIDEFVTIVYEDER